MIREQGVALVYMGPTTIEILKDKAEKVLPPGTVYEIRLTTPELGEDGRTFRQAAWYTNEDIQRKELVEYKEPEWVTVLGVYLVGRFRTAVS